ncbi:hypothetical protein [Chitinilyticum piscinae]|uniref:TolC family protein n=1 Tax=Chitinilyticum piscinae TaxID=2866724 RepID=A0A8J7FKM6_9NEIS|nr:hypothetical protein [Chitinilyticum piscinae]MBE9608249.1 hypothetical protein [Chitinilyticum piscinae]
MTRKIPLYGGMAAAMLLLAGLAPAAAPPSEPVPALWLGQAPLRATELASMPLDADRVARIAILNAPALRPALREHGISPAQLAVLPLWQQTAAVDIGRDVLGLAQAPQGRTALAQAVLDSVREARLAWLQLALASQTLQVCEQQARAADAALTLMEAQVQAGNAAEEKRLPLRQAARAAARERLHCAAALAKAQRRLASVLDLPDATTLRTAPLPALPASLPQAELPQWLAASPTGRQLQQQQAIEAAALLPRAASRSLRLPLTGALDPEGMPAVSAAQLELGLQQAGLRAQLADDWAALELTFQEYRSLSEQLPDAQSYTRVMLTHYNGMLGSVYELIDARAAEFALQRELLEKQAAFWEHAFTLEARLGAPVIINKEVRHAAP